MDRAAADLNVEFDGNVKISISSSSISPLSVSVFYDYMLEIVLS